MFDSSSLASVRLAAFFIEKGTKHHRQAIKQSNKYKIYSHNKGLIVYDNVSIIVIKEYTICDVNWPTYQNEVLKVPLATRYFEQAAKIFGINIEVEKIDGSRISFVLASQTTQ